MMTTVLGAVGAIALLSVMLLVHEVGHFAVAKLSGVVVEEFGFGYPPRLLTLFRRKGTEYTLNAIPFGAFVRMKGEDDPQGPGSFVNRPRRLRAAVLLAGAGMNIVMAVLMLTAAFMVGYPVLQQGARVVRVLEGSAAAEAGLQAGDVILQMDDTVLTDFGDLSPYVTQRAGQLIELAVRRGQETLFVDVTPRSEQGGGVTL
jgi:regulator of sigma E protease